MIDSHAHLDMDAFDPDRQDVLARAKAAGVRKILSLGLMDGKASYRKAFEIVVRETAEVLAKVKGLSSREIEAATDENFHRFFAL